MSSGHFEGTPLMYLETVFFGIIMFIILYFIVIVCVMVYRTKTLSCGKIQISSFKKSLKNNAHAKNSPKISLKIDTTKIKNYIFEIKTTTKKFYMTKAVPRCKTLHKQIESKAVSAKKIALEKLQEIKKSK